MERSKGEEEKENKGGEKEGGKSKPLLPQSIQELKVHTNAHNIHY